MRQIGLASFGFVISILLIFSGFTLSASRITPVSFAPVAYAHGGGGGSGGHGLFGIIIGIAIAVVLPEIAPAFFEATSVAVEVSEGVFTAADTLGMATSFNVVGESGAILGSGIGAQTATFAAGSLVEGANMAYFVSVNPLASLAGSALSGTVGGGGPSGSSSGSPSGFYVPSTNATPDPGEVCYSEKNSCGKSYVGTVAQDPATGKLGCKVGDSFALPACFTPTTDSSGTPYSYDPTNNKPGGVCRSAENACGMAYNGVLDYFWSCGDGGGEVDPNVPVNPLNPACAPDGSGLHCFASNVHTVGSTADVVPGYGLVSSSQTVIRSVPPEDKCPAKSPPTATLSATPSVIDSGQSSSLTWSASGEVTSCTGTGFSTGGATSNSTGVSTGALTTTSTYQLTCTGPGGSSTPSNATVTVLEPEVSISAEHPRAKNGDTVAITWNGKDIQSCIVSDLTGAVLASGTGDKHQFSTGSPYSAKITTQSIFKITCQTLSDPITKSVTVNVVPTYGEF